MDGGLNWVWLSCVSLIQDVLWNCNEIASLSFWSGSSPLASRTPCKPFCRIVSQRHLSDLRESKISQGCLLWAGFKWHLNFSGSCFLLDDKCSKWEGFLKMSSWRPPEKLPAMVLIPYFEITYTVEYYFLHIWIPSLKYHKVGKLLPSMAVLKSPTCYVCEVEWCAHLVGEHIIQLVSIIKYSVLVKYEIQE